MHDGWLTPSREGHKQGHMNPRAIHIHDGKRLPYARWPGGPRPSVASSFPVAFLPTSTGCVEALKGQGSARWCNNPSSSVS